jgi:hypothetical protein
MKRGPDALRTAEIEEGGRKTGKRDPTPSENGKREWTPSVPPKMSQVAQNIKTGPDALGTTRNEPGRAKHENGTRRSRYRRK